jgi:hypothetical protein
MSAMRPPYERVAELRGARQPLLYGAQNDCADSVVKGDGLPRCPVEDTPWEAGASRRPEWVDVRVAEMSRPVDLRADPDWRAKSGRQGDVDGGSGRNVRVA